MTQTTLVVTHFAHTQCFLCGGHDRKPPPMVPMRPDIFKNHCFNDVLIETKALKVVFWLPKNTYRCAGAMTFESPKSPQPKANSERTNE